MPRHPQYDATDRLAILLHGGIKGIHGKTGLALIRFATERVVVVIDSHTDGEDLGVLTGIPLERPIPIVSTVEEALKYGPETMALGLAALGGKLPQDWIGQLQAALQGGLNILNGLHTSLSTDERFVPHVQAGRWIWDIRKEPSDLVSGMGLSRLLPCKRVLFVGTDMSIGKMSAAISFHRGAVARGKRSKFMATGQTGIMLEGDGIALDAIRVDFASGAVQQELAACAKDRDVVFIEGQGSLLNPASTATLPLMRGSQPSHLVLVHRAQMHHLRDFKWVRIPPLRDVVAMLESIACAGGALAPVKVASIALNTHGLSDAEARYEVERTQAETGLLVQDVVRWGAEKLLPTVGID